MRFLAVVALFAVAILPAHLAGQYSRRRGPTSATATAGPYKGPAVTFNGTVKSITKKDVLVELDRNDPSADQESLTFRFSKKTTFTKADQTIKATDIAVGNHVSLDAIREGDQKLTALNVIVGEPGKSDGKQPAK